MRSRTEDSELIGVRSRGHLCSEIEGTMGKVGADMPNGTETESMCVNLAGGCDGDKWGRTVSEGSSGGVGWMGT
jgi:hypothetical protein